MKSISKEEFQQECKKLQFRGKCAVLHHDNRLQNMHRVSLEYKDGNLKDIQLLQNSIDEDTSAILVNLEISSQFPFYKVKEIMNELLKYISHEVDLVFTTTYDDDKEVGLADITVVTGVGDNSYQYYEKTLYKFDGTKFQKCKILICDKDLTHKVNAFVWSGLKSIKRRRIK